jgi:Calcium-dependent channel, 7TM region, putative phosphate
MLIFNDVSPIATQYGWEFPAQLLVIMIVFTYAVICPVIVPFGLLYFIFSLVVYKKQILYVYQPVYESGGAMFPGVLQKTLFGLACGQLTLIGYLFTRGAIVQAVFLMPLPMVTVWGMGYFHENYSSKSSRKRGACSCPLTSKIVFSSRLSYLCAGRLQNRLRD